jgi:hypothetical protein
VKKGNTGIILGVTSLALVGMARLMTSDVPINTGYSKGSVGDSLSKGVATGFMKYMAIVFALGAIIFASIGILSGLVSFGKKPNSPVKILLGAMFSIAAIYFGILVFRSVTR